MYWYLAENNQGKRGIMPINFVEVRTISESVWHLLFHGMILLLCGQSTHWVELQYKKTHEHTCTHEHIDRVKIGHWLPVS